jgi:hypothetical protein
MSQPQIPLKVPETMTPTEIGAYMGGLREHFKLSLQDVSEQLHIRVRYVQAMEQGLFDQMPGKVYARGYIHTYAEFLGLDADQVVVQCFGAETASAASVPLVPRRPVPVRKQVMTNWRGLGIAAVMAIGAALLFTQFAGGNKGEDTASVSTVEPVPEDLLESVRNLVMATPQNIDCLGTDLLLACFYADNTTQQIRDVEKMNGLRFAGNIDVSRAALAAAPKAAAKPAEAADDGDDEEEEPAEKPTKKPVAKPASNRHD